MDAIFESQNKIKQNLGLRKVEVVHNPNYHRHGTKSYVYLLNRFGFKPTKPGPYTHVSVPKQRGLVPAKFKAALGGRTHMEHTLVKKTGTGADAKTGEVTAEDQQNDSEYLCEVQIGTPPQKLMLDFDTGSADCWVFSTEMSAATQKGHNVFNSAKSTTFKSLPSKTWKISYGDGSTASGTCGTDTLVVGGLSVENQVIESAKQVAAQFSQGTGDGLLGLAWSTINTVMDESGTPDPQNTPVENMIQQTDIPKDAELFTSAFYSDRDADAKSFYTFGYIDQDLVTASGADIAWADVDNSQGFWSVQSSSVSINGKTVEQSGNTAIMDTGTTLALMSDKVVDALYAQIKGATYDDTQQGYIIPAGVTAADLPDFKVAIGDNMFTIQKEDLVFAPLENGGWYGGVQSRGTMEFDILGDVCLKSIYAIWDQGNKRFGAVPKIEKTQNLDTPSTSGGAAGSEKVTSTSMISKI